MSEVAAWIAAISALISLFVSLAALQASRSAMRASEAMSQLDQKIELSLSRFEDKLLQKRVFASEEVTDLRLKGVDNSLHGLEHRTARNTEHIGMIFNALLQNGSLKFNPSDPTTTGR